MPSPNPTPTDSPCVSLCHLPRFVSARQPHRHPTEVVDVCYKPAHFATSSIVENRRKAWLGKMNSAHDPTTGDILPRTNRIPADHPTYQMIAERGLPEPRLTPLGRKLVGLEAY